MVKALSVEEQNKRTTCLPLNMLPEASKKPKMKVKAAKVIKLLLNFLQIKPKRKQEEHEKSSTPTFVQDSICEDDHEFSPLGISKPLEAVSTRERIDNGLSLSWSYLVHDVAVNSACHLNDIPHAGDIIENGGIFYNESYFEDDYWQDYRGQSDLPMRSPVVCDIFSQHFSEPEKTPYGEFKRNSIRPETSRRHNSLPNIIVDDTVDTNTSQTKDLDDEILENYDQLVFNNQELGLKIAFEDLLDETNVCESKFFSSNRIQFFTDDSQYAGHFSEFRNTNYVIKYLESNNSFDETSVWISDTSSLGSPDCFKQLNFNITPERSDNTEWSSSLATDESFNDVIGLDSELSQGLCSMDLSLSPTAKAVTLHPQEDSTVSKESPKQRDGPESGYNSNNSTSPSSPVSSPELLTIYSVARKQTKAKMKDVLTEADLDIENSCSVHDNRTVSFCHSYFTLPTKDLPRQKILANTKIPTSSPMQVTNSPSLASHKILKPAFCYLSPIEQNHEKAKAKNLTETSESKSKINISEKQRYFLGDIVPLPNTLHFLRKQSPILGKDETNFSESSTEPYLRRVAEFIVNRIQFKDELKSDINMEKLLKYLYAYYTEEIAKLANKNISSFSDYQDIIKEACDNFTIDHLTQENCFSELLTGILGNRPTMVSACGEFICNNPHLFISQDFLKAPPELIVMLLSYYHTSVNSPGVKLKNGEPKLDVKRAMGSYLETHRAENFERYSEVKRMITYTIYRKSAFQMRRKLACNNLISVTSSQRHLRDPEYQSYEQFGATPERIVMSSSLSNSKQGYKTSHSSDAKKSCSEDQIDNFQVSYRLPRSVSEIATWFNHLEQKPLTFKAPACESSSLLGSRDLLESNNPVVSDSRILQERAYVEAHKSDATFCTLGTGDCCPEDEGFPAANSVIENNICAGITTRASDIESDATTILPARRQVHLSRAKTFSSIYTKPYLSLAGETASVLVDHQTHISLRRWGPMGNVLSTEL